jgi:hypothetical protein
MPDLWRTRARATTAPGGLGISSAFAGRGPKPGLSPELLPYSLWLSRFAASLPIR